MGPGYLLGGVRAPERWFDQSCAVPTAATFTCNLPGVVVVPELARAPPPVAGRSALPPRRSLLAKSAGILRPPRTAVLALAARQRLSRRPLRGAEMASTGVPSLTQLPRPRRAIHGHRPQSSFPVRRELQPQCHAHFRPQPFARGRLCRQSRYRLLNFGRYQSSPSRRSVLHEFPHGSAGADACLVPMPQRMAGWATQEARPSIQVPVSGFHQLRNHKSHSSTTACS